MVRRRITPKKLTIAGTGHRPNKLGGYSTQPQLVTLCEDWLRVRQPDKVISGMALGFDQALATAAINLCIPFIAAIPFKTQHSRWPRHAQLAYHQLLDRADEHIVVCPGEYASWKMQARNKWMVDRADEILALWNGSAGGTANCIAYAQKKQIKINNLWDQL